MKKKRNITSIQAITVVIKAPVISSIVLEFLDCLISSYSSYGYHNNQLVNIINVLVLLNIQIFIHKDFRLNSVDV